jgi:hypothetical protein
MDEPPGHVLADDESLWHLLRGAWITVSILIGSLAFSIVFWRRADFSSWAMILPSGTRPP